MAKLLLESGGERREIRISGPVTIGRSKTSTVYVDNKTLSREHTLVYEDRGRYYVRDLDSKNGTFLNNASVKQAQRLSDGDLIKLGPSVSLVFILDAGEADASPRLPVAAVAAPPMPAAPPPLPPAAPASESAAGPATARARPRNTERSSMELPSATITLIYNAIIVGVAIVAVFVFKKIFYELLLWMDP